MTGISFYLNGHSTRITSQKLGKYSKVKLGYFCLFSTLIPFANHLSLFREIVQERRIGTVLGAFANKYINTSGSRGWGVLIARAVIADSANAASVQGEVS